MVPQRFILKVSSISFPFGIPYIGNSVRGGMVYLVLSLLIITPVLAQTDKGLLSEYDSLQEWQIPQNEFDSLMSKHYKGGNESFMQELQKNSTYPELEGKLGSEAIVLVTYRIHEDSTDHEFHNTVRKGFRDKVTEQLEHLDQGWEKIPLDGLSLKLSISFSSGSRSGKEKSASIEFTSFRMGRSSPGYECFNIEDGELLGLVRSNTDERVKMYFLKEYLQRNPFSKEGHEIYRSIVKDQE